MKAKKFFALLLVAVMLLSLSVTAFAANSDGESYTRGSITIKNPQEGETYKAYKIFDVTYDLTDSTNEKYAYTINLEWVDDVQGYVGNTKGEDGTYPAITAKGLTITPVKDSAGTVQCYTVARVQDDPTTADVNEDIFSAPDFAEKMKEAIGTKEADATFTNGVASNLDLGYYMVQPTVGTLVSLTTTDADVQVSDKNEKPVVDKKLVGEERVLICKKQSADPNAANYEADHVHSEENGCYAEKDYTTKSVGDNVPFELDTKVPDMTGYETYFFVMNDTMTAGLTFNNDVSITLGGEPLAAGTDYTVKVTENEDGTTNIRIVFKDMTKWWSNDENEDHEGEPIVIKYSATVDEDAVMGTVGNTNTAKIEYSNNPNIVPEYNGPEEDPDDDPDFDPDDPQDPKYKHNQTTETTDDPTGVSVEDKVTVYTAELDITKVDAADGTTPLTGAKFKIEGEKLNVSIVNKTIFQLDNTNGTYYRLKDGTYTEESPDKNGENKTTYAEMGDGFVPVEYTELTGSQAVPNVGLYFSEDNGATKTLITDTNIDSVPAGAKIYQPTYNTVGLFVNTGTEETPVWVEVTETNAAQYTSGTFYKATVWKQSDLYENTEEKYKKVEVIDKTNTGAGKYTAEGFVGANGVITFAGLAEGTYKITELIAPDGYNLLKAPVEVVVKLVAGDTANSYKFQATVDGAVDPVTEANSVLSFNIENNQGIELPETGGIGTKIFYVMGGLLIVAAGVLLITKKRMARG